MAKGYELEDIEYIEVVKFPDPKFDYTVVGFKDEGWEYCSCHKPDGTFINNLKKEN